MATVAEQPAVRRPAVTDGDARHIAIAIPWARIAPMALVALVSALYLLPRLLFFDRLVTADESIWLGRSANFYAAIMNRNLAETYQFAHPGVTTMWAGAIAFFLEAREYASVYPEPHRTVRTIQNQLYPIGIDPLQLLIAARVVKVLFQLALFLTALHFIRRLFGLPIALGAALMLSLEPFLLAHDRFLHVDGIAAMSGFTAVLAIVSATGIGRTTWRPWAVAGVLAAIAWLSRSTNAILIVVALAGMVYLVLQAVRHERIAVGKALRALVGPAVAFAAGSVVTTFALWPALWIDPVAVIQEMLVFTEDAIVTGHELSVIFDGRVVDGDPGVLFYPYNILWRISPVTIVGVVLFIPAALRYRTRLLRPTGYLGLGLLLLYAGIYSFGMTVSAKKLDRYMLPDFPVIVLAAACGFVGIGALLWASRRETAQVLACLLLVGGFGLQAALAQSAMPYGLTFYNPALGGIRAADGNMLLGWGEGLDLGADYILDQPGGANATVMTSAHRQSLLYLVPQSVNVALVRPAGTVPALQTWLETDYYVGYVLQWQRGLNPDEVGYLRSYRPAFTARFDGVDYTQVWALRNIPVPPTILAGATCRYVYNDDVMLVDSIVRTGDADQAGQSTLDIVVPFITLLPSASERTLLVHLTITGADDGRLIGSTRQPLAMSATGGVARTVEYRQLLPEGYTGDDVVVNVVVVDTRTNAAIAPVSGTTPISGTAFPLANCE